MSVGEDPPLTGWKRLRANESFSSILIGLTTTVIMVISGFQLSSMWEALRLTKLSIRPFVALETYTWKPDGLAEGKPGFAAIVRNGGQIPAQVKAKCLASTVMRLSDPYPHPRCPESCSENPSGDQIQGAVLLPNAVWNMPWGSSKHDQQTLTKAEAASVREGSAKLVWRGCVKYSDVDQPRKLYTTSFLVELDLGRSKEPITVLDFGSMD